MQKCNICKQNLFYAVLPCEYCHNFYCFTHAERIAHKCKKVVIENKSRHIYPANICEKCGIRPNYVLSQCNKCKGTYCNTDLKKGNHPCIDFQNKIDDQQIRKHTLENLNQYPEKYNPKFSNHKNNKIEKRIHTGDSESHIFKKIFYLILISLFVFFGYLLIENGAISIPRFSIFENNETQSSVIQNKNCSILTANYECSNTKPLYCDNGKFVSRPDICGCEKGFRVHNSECIPEVKCSDGSFEPDCAFNQPLKCIGGKLVDRATECGCPDNYKIAGESCVKIQRCSDGTIYDECSSVKPKYCLDGQLIDKAATCGCAGDSVAQGDSCLSKYMTGAKIQTYPYVLRSVKKVISFTVYSGLVIEMGNPPSTYYCNPTCPSDQELEMRFFNNQNQERELQNLAQAIKNEVPDDGNRARIAISLVQNIPYDYAKLNAGDLFGSRYPYTTLFDQTGVCGEKSKLLAGLLKDLGIEVVLMTFEAENHQAVGIKCPVEQSFRGTGYCFIEATQPSIPTDDGGDYVGVGKLTSTPKIIPISTGNSVDFAEEVQDVAKYNALMSMGQTLPEYQYNEWRALVLKYGMKTN